MALTHAVRAIRQRPTRQALTSSCLPRSRRFSGYHVGGEPQTVPHAWDHHHDFSRAMLEATQAAGSDHPFRVAVVGGGVTGMVTALNLAGAWSQQVEGKGTSSKLHLTIYEAGPTLGGWLGGSSQRVALPDGSGNVLFESGPRTLRPKGASAPWMLDLLAGTGMLTGGGGDDLLICPKDAPAATNRYVYYPDRLQKMPGTGAAFDWAELYDFLARSPLGKPVVPGVLNDFLKRGRLARDDVSVGEFLAANFNGGVRDLASAVLHGIYAGDVDQLSLGALMPKLLHYARHHGSVTRGALSTQAWLALTKRKVVSVPQDLDTFANTMDTHDAETFNAMGDLWNKASVFSFRDGLAQITRRVEERLRKRDNVEIKLETKVASIEVGRKSEQEDGPVSITDSSGSTEEYDYVAATLSSSTLASVLSAPGAKPETVDRVKRILSYNPSVDVMVVNLYYQDPNLLPVEGFGYLIPKSIPIEQNPELGLGVVFDSHAIQGQDEVAQPGTKLTVMLGGHCYDAFDGADLPTEKEGILNAQSLLKRHLGIDDEPLLARATLQKNCIPQYLVGHPGRMAELHKLLGEPGLGYRIRVGGSSYSGVGVNDCVASGYRLAATIRQHRYDSGLWAPTKFWCGRIVPNVPEPLTHKE